MQREQVGGAEGFTRFFTWVPSIDALLSSRRIAYYREIFREIDLGDPIEDDLFEVLAPHRTGAGLSVQVDDTWGPGTALRLTDALARNLSLPQAFQLEGLDPLRIAPWRAAIPRQDYVLTVDDRGASVRRDAPPDAPTETVVIAVDGAPSP